MAASERTEREALDAVRAGMSRSDEDTLRTLITALEERLRVLKALIARPNPSR